jgi:hypothetical protein
MVTHHIICGTQGGANACGLQIRRYLKHKFADVLQLYPCHERAFRSVIGIFECANIPDYGSVKGRYKSLLDSNIFYVEECFNFA